MHPHTGVDEIDEAWFEGATYEHYGSYNSPKRSLPLKLHESQPVVGKRLVAMTIEVETDNVVSVLWGGQTYNFRSLHDKSRNA